MEHYAQYVAHAWNLRGQGVLTLHEQDMYLFLLNQSNKAKNLIFYQSTAVLCAILGVNRNALSTRRQRLKDLGLITFRVGKGRTCPPRYKICSLPETDSELTKAEAFVPPSLNDVLTYCNQRNSNIDPHRFFTYYQAREWQMGSGKMRNWQSAIQTWEQTEKTSKHSFAKCTNSDNYVQF